MKKNYTSAEILDMAIKKAAASYYADLDRNGEVDAADARIALRREKGLDGAAGESGSAPNGSAASAGNGKTGTGAFGGYDGGESSLIKKELLDSVIADTGRSYDITADKLYDEYRREYEKNAGLAAKDAYGTAAAGTGGYGSSYAAGAAADAYGRYLSALADKLPEFAESAAAVKKSGIQSRLNVLSEMRRGESEEYSRYSDSVKNAWTAAENGDYSFLEALGMDTSGMREDKAMNEALSAAKYGDYSGLKYMGVDTSAVEYADLLDTAAKIAKQGDYSFLEALGVDVGGLKSKDKLEKALALAKYGDYSLLGDFSSNIASIKEKINFTVQRGAASAYAAGGYRGLVGYLDRQINYGQITEKGKEQIINALTRG